MRSTMELLRDTRPLPRLMCPEPGHQPLLLHGILNPLTQDSLRRHGLAHPIGRPWSFSLPFRFYRHWRPVDVGTMIQRLLPGSAVRGRSTAWQAPERAARRIAGGCDRCCCSLALSHNRAFCLHASWAWALVSLVFFPALLETAGGSPGGLLASVWLSFVWLLTTRTPNLTFHLLRPWPGDPALGCPAGLLRRLRVAFGIACDLLLSLCPGLVLRRALVPSGREIPAADLRVGSCRCGLPFSGDIYLLGVHRTRHNFLSAMALADAGLVWSLPAHPLCKTSWFGLA